jgi:hypothetical protein
MTLWWVTERWGSIPCAGCYLLLWWVEVTDHRLQRTCPALENYSAAETSTLRRGCDDQSILVAVVTMMAMIAMVMAMVMTIPIAMVMAMMIPSVAMVMAMVMTIPIAIRKSGCA